MTQLVILLHFHYRRRRHHHHLLLFYYLLPLFPLPPPPHLLQRGFVDVKHRRCSGTGAPRPEALADGEGGVGGCRGGEAALGVQAAPGGEAALGEALGSCPRQPTFGV